MRTSEFRQAKTTRDGSVLRGRGSRPRNPSRPDDPPDIEGNSGERGHEKAKIEDQPTAAKRTDRCRLETGLGTEGREEAEHAVYQDAEDSERDHPLRSLTAFRPRRPSKASKAAASRSNAPGREDRPAHSTGSISFGGKSMSRVRSGKRVHSISGFRRKPLPSR